MAGGDSNGDGTINTFDKVHFWKLVTGKSGYLTSDYILTVRLTTPTKTIFGFPIRINSAWYLIKNIRYRFNGRSSFTILTGNGKINGRD
jgi:hypothetical protein